ncbi:MAG: CBS domain-containing protein [Methanosarcinales archaeon]|nr:MAG: CBS domain-containing protein [Methanosarcinales archaeon]
MKVKDVMNTNVITCTPEETVKNAAQVLKKRRISGLPVVKNNRLVGIVTETDILKLLKNPSVSEDLWLPSPFEVIEVPLRELIGWEELKHSLESIENKPVEKIMTKKVYTVSPEDSIETASEKMVKHRINRLPVMENEKLAGIVARGDIIKALSDERSKNIVE